jgi:hypothetical protein
VHDEYTDEWQVGTDGVPRAVDEGERTGPMSTSLPSVVSSVVSNVIVEEPRPQHAQTRVVKSPFADNEKTIGGAALQRGGRSGASPRQDETQPVTKRPVPRPPKLPNSKAAKADEASKSTRAGGAGPAISDNKRS